MAAETFTWTPSYNSTVEVKPLTTSIKFGDGYAQDTPNGINSQPRTYQLTFSNRLTADADAICQFIARQGGVKWFWYQHPGATIGKFKCRQGYRRADGDPGSSTITATFEEVFDPGV